MANGWSMAKWMNEMNGWNEFMADGLGSEMKWITEIESWHNFWYQNKSVRNKNLCVIKSEWIINNDILFENR